MKSSALTIDKKLENKLGTGIVAFNYRKSSGEIRYAAGTTDMSLYFLSQVYLK